MTLQVDLGRSIYRADSNLQLQLVALMNCNPSIHWDPTIPIDVEFWSDYAILITEAPLELELRLLVTGESSLDTTLSVSMPSMVDRLCNAKIWPDLGFSLMFKNCDIVKEKGQPGTHRLTFGLKKNEIAASTKGRTLPAVLQDPPDARPPATTPTMSLASIDISLEYGCYFENIQQVHQLFDLTISPNRTRPDPLVLAASFLKADIGSFLSTDPLIGKENTPKDLSQGQSCSTIECFKSLSQPRDSSTNGVSQELFRLLDFALQRLTISTLIKDSEIQVLGQESLRSIPETAPAVFNPTYREAINQRAVSIPMIGKAVCSMLEKNGSPILQGKIKQLLQGASGLTRDFYGRSPSLTNPQAIIQSALWRIAEIQLRNVKYPRKSNTVSATDLVLEEGHPQDALLVPSFEQHMQNHCAFPEPDRYYGTDYEDEDADADMIQDCHSDGSEDLLFENTSEHSFMDIVDSTQTTMTSLFTEDPPSAPYCVESEMLLSYLEQGAFEESDVMEVRYSQHVDVDDWDLMLDE